MNKRFRPGTAQKITFAVLAILLIPVLVISALAYRSYVQSLQEEANRELALYQEAVSSSLSASREKAIQALDRLSYSQEFLYFLDAASTPGDREKMRFWSDLSEEWMGLRRTYPNLFSMAVIYSKNPNVWTDRIRRMTFLQLDEESLADTDEVSFGLVCEGTAADTGTDGFGTEKEWFFPARKSICNFSTGEEIGVLELWIPLERAADYLSLSHYADRASICFSSREGEAALKIPAQSIDDAADSSKALTLEWQEADLGLLVSISMDQKQVLAPARRMLAKVVLAALGAILLLLLLTYLAARLVLGRLMELDKAMGELSYGNFAVRLQPDHYGDEVSRLKEQFLLMSGRLQTAMDEVVEREKAQARAELAALQAQINPHFLFNTLETMRMQCELEGSYQVSKGLEALGGLLRYSIRKDEPTVPFAMEWRHLKNYVKLMAMRLDDRFTYQLDCPDDLGEIAVPKMILQPLVENSFQHGFKAVPPPWHLAVCAAREGKDLIIDLSDNGGGIAPEKLSALQAMLLGEETADAAGKSKSGDREMSSKEAGHMAGNGIGMVNVAARLKMLCGEGSSVILENAPEGGTHIHVTICLFEECPADCGGVFDQKRKGG